MAARNVTARLRAKLKAKKRKERARKAGLATVKSPGGRLKVVRNKEWRRKNNKRIR